MKGVSQRLSSAYQKLLEGLISILSGLFSLAVNKVDIKIWTDLTAIFLFSHICYIFVYILDLYILQTYFWLIGQCSVMFMYGFSLSDKFQSHLIDSIISSLINRFSLILFFLNKDINLMEQNLEKLDL